MPMTNFFFKILKVGDRPKNLSRASPSPPTGQLKNLGRGFSFYTRPFRSFNFDFVDLFYLKFSSIFSKRCNLKIHETNIKRTKRTSIKAKILFQDSSVGPGGDGEALLKFFDLSPTLRISNFFLSWAYPGGIPSNQFNLFTLKDS